MKSRSIISGDLFSTKIAFVFSGFSFLLSAYMYGLNAIFNDVISAFAIAILVINCLSWIMHNLGNDKSDLFDAITLGAYGVVLIVLFVWWLSAITKPLDISLPPKRIVTSSFGILSMLNAICHFRKAYRLGPPQKTLRPNESSVGGTKEMI